MASHLRRRGRGQDTFTTGASSAYTAKSTASRPHSYASAGGPSRAGPELPHAHTDSSFQEKKAAEHLKTWLEHQTVGVEPSPADGPAHL